MKHNAKFIIDFLSHYSNNQMLDLNSDAVEVYVWKQVNEWLKDVDKNRKSQVDRQRIYQNKIRTKFTPIKTPKGEK